MPFNCRLYNYVPHGFLDVTLQTTHHEVISRGFQEVTSELQIISHVQAVTSTVDRYSVSITNLIYFITSYKAPVTQSLRPQRDL